MINIPIVTDHVAFRSATGYYYDPGFIDYPLAGPESGRFPAAAGAAPSAYSDADYTANLHKREDLNFEKTFTTRNQLLSRPPRSEGDHHLCLSADQDRRSPVQQRRRIRHGQPRKCQPLCRAGQHATPIWSASKSTRTSPNSSMLSRPPPIPMSNSALADDNTDLLLDLDYDYALPGLHELEQILPSASSSTRKSAWFHAMGARSAGFSAAFITNRNTRTTTPSTPPATLGRSRCPIPKRSNTPAISRPR